MQKLRYLAVLNNM